jgi:hypothetical protein
LAGVHLHLDDFGQHKFGPRAQIFCGVKDRSDSGYGLNNRNASASLPVTYDFVVTHSRRWFSLCLGVIGVFVGHYVELRDSLKMVVS